LNSVDGGLELVDLLLQGLLNFPDILHVIQRGQVFLEAGVVDDDVCLLLVNNLAWLAVRDLGTKISVVQMLHKINIPMVSYAVLTSITVIID